MPRIVTIEDVKAARATGCKWDDAAVEAAWRAGNRPAQCPLAQLIAGYLEAPKAEHLDRSLIVKRLLTDDQRRRVGMLRGPEPTAYMRKALAVVQADDEAERAAAPAAPAAPPAPPAPPVPPNP